MKQIPLTQGKFALIDDRDYWLVRQFKWYAYHSGRNWYAAAFPKGCGDRNQNMTMHRLLAGFPPFALDHRNGDGLDNRRHNLRPATGSQNHGNSRLRCDNTSGHKGVYWHGYREKWAAHIKFHGRTYHLGLFANLKDAAAAYQKAAKQLFGEFAKV
jgi:hypothetical protein